MSKKEKILQRISKTLQHKIRKDIVEEKDEMNPKHQILLQSTKKAFKCPICDSSLTTKKYLNEHLNCVHYNEKKFKCDVCQTPFGNKGNLKRHMRGVHENEKAFKCDICLTCFRYRSHLNSHSKAVHNNKKSAVILLRKVIELNYNLR